MNDKNRRFLFSFIQESKNSTIQITIYIFPFIICCQKQRFIWIKFSNSQY